jgi:peptide chain release factor subunit 1
LLQSGEGALRLRAAQQSNERTIKRMTSKPTTPLGQTLDRLAELELTEYPFISLYLNTQPDQHGRDNFDAFVRKEFRARAKTYAAGSPERESFDRDTERINAYLSDELEPSANGVAIFSCSGAGEFFEAVQLDAPIEEHRLYVHHLPHLYPLARLMDQYPRYAVLVTDTNSARIFVFGRGSTINTETVTNPKVNRTSVGGWSQMRYQRHVENYHLHHAKEVIDALERVVAEERAGHVILAGDEVIIPVLREQMPQQLADKVIDVLRLDNSAPEHEVLKETMEALREHDAESDAEKVKRLFDEYRAGGLGVVGARATLAALTMGQVDELLISASLEQIDYDEREIEEQLDAGTQLALEAVSLQPEEAEADTQAGEETRTAIIADEFVTKARQTSAKVTFIEDASLLATVGGVGAMLRYKI